MEIDGKPFGSVRCDIPSNVIAQSGEEDSPEVSQINLDHDHPYASEDLKQAKILYEVERKEFRNQIAVLKKVRGTILLLIPFQVS